MVMNGDHLVLEDAESAKMHRHAIFILGDAPLDVKMDTCKLNFATTVNVF